MTNIPNYQELKAETERISDALADVLADKQKEEAKHVQALLTLAAQNPDAPVSAIAMKALSRHYDPALPAAPGWARVHAPAVADREVIRLVGAQRMRDMADSEQAALILESGDPSAAVLEQERRMAPILAERAEYRRKQVQRELELAAARKWVWDQQALQASLSSAAADASAAKAIDAQARQRNQDSFNQEEALLAQYRAAVGMPQQLEGAE